MSTLFNALGGVGVRFSSAAARLGHLQEQSGIETIAPELFAILGLNTGGEWMTEIAGLTGWRTYARAGTIAAGAGGTRSRLAIRNPPDSGIITLVLYAAVDPAAAGRITLMRPTAPSVGTTNFTPALIDFRYVGAGAGTIFRTLTDVLAAGAPLRSRLAPAGETTDLVRGFPVLLTPQGSSSAATGEVQIHGPTDASAIDVEVVIAERQVATVELQL